MRLKHQIQALPLDMIATDDLPENVRLALQRDDDRKRQLIQRVVPMTEMLGFLVREPTSGHAMLRHEATVSSGGRVSFIEIGDGRRS